MQKWMGFFLSEHTSSLHAAKNRVDFSTDLSKPQKLLLLSQLYANQLKGQFTIKHRDRKVTLFGVDNAKSAILAEVEAELDRPETQEES